MHLERNSEVGAGFEETVHPKFGVAFETENLDLDDVYQCVNQGPLRQSLIESDEIDASDGVHMSDLGGLKTEGPHVGKKLRHRQPSSAKFNDANALEQARGEMRPHPSLALVGEGAGHRGEILALFTHGNP